MEKDGGQRTDTQGAAGTQAEEISMTLQPGERDMGDSRAAEPTL